MTKIEQKQVYSAITKISSALINIDKINIENNPRFCGKMKRDFMKFCNFFDYHTKETTNSLYYKNKDNWNLVTYYYFDGINDDVVASTEEKKHISLFLCKCESAVLDLKKLDKNITNRIFALPLINRIDEILDKKYIKNFDVDKEDLALLTNTISDIGNKTIKDEWFS